jgi:hypothetical protein
LIQLLLGAGRGWTAARGVATPAGAVAARVLSDEGDDPGLTDRVGPPVSEREATAESDKQQEGGDGRIGQAATGRRRPNRTSEASRLRKFPRKCPGLSRWIGPN